MKKICIIALLLGIVQGAWADTTGSWVNSDYRDNSWGSDYSSSDAFTVSTAAQLAQLAYMVAYEDKFFQNKTITLSADIDLSAHFWLPIGTVQASSFKGSFDGARHTIKGIYINETRAYSGLFGYIDGGAWIKNIKITDSNINADSQYTGAIVGYSTNCKIENCSVASSVEVTSTRVPSSGQDAATGGLVGRLSSGSAELWGCVSAAFVNGKEKVGGLVGEVVSSHVVSCLYTGSSVQAPESITTQAALFGNINGGDYLHYNLYTNSALDDKNGQDKRGYAITPPSGVTLNFGSPVNSYDVSGISYYTFSTGSTNYSLIAYEGLMYCASDQRITFTVSAPLGYVVSFSVTASAGNLSESGGTYELFTTNSDCIISATAELTEWVGEGTGTEAKPYLVKTCDDLRWIACYTNAENSNHYTGKYFQLANNIAFDGTANNFTTIGNSSSKYFAGTFDGQNYTISGINISADGGQGLFGTVSGATIKNLTLSSSIITSTNGNSAGGIVSSAGNSGVTIENCHVSESVTIGSGNASGGIIGRTSAGNVSITGCTSGATISTRNNGSCVGGIIGYCGRETSLPTTYVSISNCLYYGTSLSGSSDKNGGIVGSFYVNTHDNSSRVEFSHNYYTYSTVAVKGSGQWGEKYSSAYDRTHDAGDITSNNIVGNDSYGAVRARMVSASADIEDMGTAGTPVANGITLYSHGIKYNNVYYSHVLALEDATDNTDVIAQYAGQTFDVKLRGRRLYKDDSWNTICLPFNLTSYTGTVFESVTGCTCEIREMDTDPKRAYYLKDKTTNQYDYSVPYKTGVNEKDGKRCLYLFFKDDNLDLTAGKPFIVKWYNPEDNNQTTATSFDPIFNPIFDNVTIVSGSPVTVTSQDGTVSFKSIYAPESFDEADRSILFVGAANTLYYPSGAGTVSLNSFRAYFQLNGVQMSESSSGSSTDDDDDYFPGPGNVKVFVFDIEEGDASGIGIVRSKTEDGRCDVWYSLDGKRLNGTPAQKGIYIHNGRKEVLK